MQIYSRLFSEKVVCTEMFMAILFVIAKVVSNPTIHLKEVGYINMLQPETTGSIRALCFENNRNLTQSSLHYKKIH